MKHLTILLLLIANFSFSQQLSKSDSLDIRIADHQGVPYFKYWIESNNNSVSISWFGNCEQIKLEKLSDSTLLIVDVTSDVMDEFQANLSHGKWSVNFYSDDVLVKQDFIEIF